MTSSSENPDRPQVQFGTLVGHAAAPAVGGVVCLLLAMVLSLANVTVNLGGMPLGAANLTGNALFGAWGWLAIAVFAAAVAARFVAAVMPYRSIADIAAVAAWAALAAMAIYQAMNPIPADAAAAMQSMGNMFGGAPVPMRPGQPDLAAGARRTVQQAISVNPGIGLVPFVAAGALAVLGLWRARSKPVA